MKNKEILIQLKNLIQSKESNNFKTTRSIEEDSAEELSYNQNKTKTFAKSSGTIYDKLMSYALKILGIKRYTRAELEIKLKTAVKKYLQNTEDEEDTQFDTQDIISKIIDRLIDLKYLDEKEYIKDFVNFRMSRKPRGIAMMKMELKKRKVPGDSIEEFFNGQNIDEIPIAEKLLERLENKLKIMSEKKQKEKIYTYLISKGFSSNTIYKVLNKKYSNSVDRI